MQYFEVIHDTSCVWLNAKLSVNVTSLQCFSCHSGRYYTFLSECWQLGSNEVQSCFYVHPNWHTLSTYFTQPSSQSTWLSQKTQTLHTWYICSNLGTQDIHPNLQTPGYTQLGKQGAMQPGKQRTPNFLGTQGTLNLAYRVQPIWYKGYIGIDTP